MSATSGDYTLAWEPTAAEVSKSGDLAYTWGLYSLTYKDENGEKRPSEQYKGYYIVDLTRTNG